MISAKIPNTGFTLIELLVVISLIGVLTTLLFANLNAARERGRDAERKADLRNIQTALRLYFNDKSGYPASDTSGQILGCGSGGITACSWGSVWTAGTTTYMSRLPADPLSSQSYKYTQTDSDTYTLNACLENNSDAQGVTDSSCPNGLLYRVQP